MEKKKIAFFSFTCCEGCQLEVLNQGSEMLDLLKHVEIVNFREAMSEKSDDYDIAFVEGSIASNEQITDLKAIRANAKTLVALGSCAVQGGINTLRNRRPITEVKEYVYGKNAENISSILASPISSFVKVDYNIRGCPIHTEDFIRFTKQLLMGMNPFQPDYPMCVDCRLNENICVFDKGMVCMGPVTRAGCNAICPTFGNKCEGCRGLVSDPNVNGHRELLRSKGLAPNDVYDEYSIYGVFDEQPEE